MTAQPVASLHQPPILQLRQASADNCSRNQRCGQLPEARSSGAGVSGSSSLPQCLPQNTTGLASTTLVWQDPAADGGGMMCAGPVILPTACVTARAWGVFPYLG